MKIAIAPFSAATAPTNNRGGRSAGDCCGCVEEEIRSGGRRVEVKIGRFRVAPNEPIGILHNGLPRPTWVVLSALACGGKWATGRVGFSVNARSWEAPLTKLKVVISPTRRIRLACWDARITLLRATGLTHQFVLAAVRLHQRGAESAPSDSQ